MNAVTLRRKNLTRRLRLHRLEDRTAPAVFTVTNLNDSGGGSLREAIDSANSAFGADTITFDVSPLSGPIELLSPLPAITAKLVIDGTTQPGYTGTPLIELDGFKTGPNANGLAVASPGVTLKGLAIGRFGESGVAVTIDTMNFTPFTYKGSTYVVTPHSSWTNAEAAAVAAKGSLVTINSADEQAFLTGVVQKSIPQPLWIGINDVAGEGGFVWSSGEAVTYTNWGAGEPNDKAPLGEDNGVLRLDGTWNDENEATVSYRAVLEFTAPPDPLVLKGAFMAPSLIEGCWIGVSPDGDPAGNDATGVAIVNSPNVTLSGNIIGDNNGPGVYLSGFTTQNIVLVANGIGTDAGRTKAIPNDDGVVITGGAGNVHIGTDADGKNDAAEANVISGNASSGVILTDLGRPFEIAQDVGGTNNWYLGTPSLYWADAFLVARGAGGDLVSVTSGSEDVFISTTVISAMGTDAWIGLNDREAEGTFAWTTGEPFSYDAWAFPSQPVNGPTLDYVLHKNSAWFVGTEQPLRAVLEFGAQPNIAAMVAQFFTPVTIAGNFIGTDLSGTKGLGNGGYGVYVESRPNVTIGGDKAAQLNLISGNGGTAGAGVGIAGPNMSNTIIRGNYIGTDLTGAVPVPNANGILSLNAANGTIGGAKAGERNIISGNLDDGVAITGVGSSAITVQGNFIGADVTGTKPLGNGRGVAIIENSNNIIGGAASGELNIISGNSGAGVLIGSGSGPAGNKVLGNYIGTDSTGLAPLPNGHGVAFNTSGAVNYIGGSADGEPNVISGNTGDGVRLTTGGSAGPLVLGNFIGTDNTGKAKLPNGRGVFIDGSGAFTVGGTAKGEPNVISGNKNDGLVLNLGSSASTRLVHNNRIGTDPDGLKALANGGRGVVINASDFVFGGAVAGQGNLVSGNTGDGVVITGGVDIKLHGNFVGTDVTGLAKLPNGRGVVFSGSANSFLGGAASGQANLVSGNTGDGVVLAGGSGTKLHRNLIGTDLTGLKSLPNARGVVFEVGAGIGHVVGGAGVDEGNLISGNTGDGIACLSGNHHILGNFIGTDVSGTAKLGNGGHGVGIYNANFIDVGRIFTTDPGNLISGNGLDGVFITGTFAFANDIRGNRIGTNAAGTAPIANGRYGVQIFDCEGNHVGGIFTGDGNLISGNAVAGVAILGLPNTPGGNDVSGNFIGTDATGTKIFDPTGKIPLGNGIGVVLGDPTGSNTVGPFTTLEGAGRNVISGNLLDGIQIIGPSAEANLINRNSIGTDVTGTLVLGNGRHGILLSGAGPNFIGNDDGTTGAGGPNTIFFNRFAGIFVELGSSGNTMRGNQIFLNGQAGVPFNTERVGIDLFGGVQDKFGTTANDLLDTDAGPNQLQNFPALTAVTLGASTKVDGSLNSVPDTDFSLDFYASALGHPSKHGEGQRFIGSGSAKTDATGNVNFSFVLAATFAGEVVTVTATNDAGSTSEFSKWTIAVRPAAAAAAPDILVPGGLAHLVDVTFFDDVGINVMTLDDADVLVTGPNGYAQLGQLKGLVVAGANVTATYAIPAAGGFWDRADNGKYTITMQQAQVYDDEPLPVSPGFLGSFTVDIPLAFVVTNTLDGPVAKTGDLPGSLRQAIFYSNVDPAVNTIVFDAAVFAAAQTITLTAGELVIADVVTITGPVAPAAVDANNLSRVLAIDVPGKSGVAVALSNLVLTRGKTAAGDGGAVLNIDEALALTGVTVSGSSAAADGGGVSVAQAAGSLTLTNCTVTGNTAAGQGGGINLDAGSTVTLLNSTVSNNAAGEDGGGIYFFFNGSLSVINSTISGNKANTLAAGLGGGGIYFYGTAGSLLIRNSTVSGNTANNGGAGYGGGILLNAFAGSASVIQNSTFTLNTAGKGGGGIFQAGGAATWDSTIIAGNSAPGTPATADVGFLNPTNVAGDNNLVGVNEAATNAKFGPATQVGTLAGPLDPQLDGLANNGGPTQTHALKAGSPAIDMGGNPAGLAFDQRGPGFARVLGKAADAGAIERQPAPPPTLVSILVNGGAVQRSMVTSVTVTFSEAVNFPLGAAAGFRLERIGQPSGGPQAASPLGLVNLNAVQAGNAVTITFLAGGAVPVDLGKSLIDGAYQLTIVAANVQGVGGAFDANGDGTGGDNFQTSAFGPDRIFRLFGDADGDGDVDVFNLGGLRAVFGNANATFDFDADGDVDVTDFAQFRQRFGATV